MKTVITFLFILILSSLFGQGKKCYDISWKEVKCSEDYNYYRIIPSNRISNELFTVKDYYKNDVLQMEGSYSDSHYLHKAGEFRYYYENGKISAVENYSNNKLSGEFKKWYTNGQLKFEGTYTEPDDIKVYENFWLENGVQSVKNGNGFFTQKSDDGSFSEGNLKDGKEDGIWTGYMKSQDIKYEEKYENGVFVEGTSQHAEKTYTYTKIQDIPYPEKGNDDLRNFIANNFKFPNKISRNNYSSAVTIVITLSESGDIFDVTTDNIIDEKVKERVISTVKKYPGKFNIPKTRGVSDKQRLRIPIVLIVE